MARKGRGRQKQGHLADMSLPAEDRHPRKGTRTSRAPVPAQLLRHGNSPAGRRKRRDGQRHMDAERDTGWGRGVAWG